MADPAQPSPSPELDVLVVGGGFAGLAAARELDALGLRFRLLDAFDDHLGGRAYSFPAGPGSPLRYDHGAEYVGDLQDAIMSIIRGQLPEDTLVNGAELRLPYPWEVMVLGGERYCFRSDQSLFGIPGCPPQLGITGALGMIGLLAEMTLVEWSIDVLEPWRGPEELLALDRVDAWTWVGGKWWVSPAVRDLVRISIEALLSVEPSEISPYYLLWYTACNDGFLNEINDDAGGPQQYWLRRGADEVAGVVAAPIRDRIQQGTRVTEIDRSGPHPVVTTASGERISARRVLVATSPATAGRIRFVPDVSPARRELLGQPMGRTIKCQVFYRSPWWRDSNGKAYDGYVGGADQPVLWVMDNSPPDADALGTYCLMTFTVGAQADRLGPSPSDEAILRWVTAALRDLFQDDRALPGHGELLRLVSHRWIPSDTFVGGGPNTVFRPGALTGAAGPELDASLDDVVFFACAENTRRLEPRSTDRRWSPFAPENLPAYDAQKRLSQESRAPFFSRYPDLRSDLGYMSGALESGRFAAHRIAQSLELPHRVPASPPPAPALASPVSPVAEPTLLPAAQLSGILADLRRLVLSASAAELRGRPGGVGSWLRETLLSLAQTHAGVAAGDAHGGLAHLRDLAASAAQHLGADLLAAAEDEVAHLRAVGEHVAAIDQHLAALHAP